jgi:hypothetical protein
VAKAQAWSEETEACLGVTKACLGEMETMIRASQEQTQAKIKAKAIQSESNQERAEAVAEYYEGVQCIKAMHILVAQQGWLSDT